MCTLQLIERFAQFFTKDEVRIIERYKQLTLSGHVKNLEERLAAVDLVAAVSVVAASLIV